MNHRPNIKHKDKIVGIIPARADSKGIPKKNIKLLGGYPLIAYSIIASKLSSKIERTIVSTDSQEIADIALSYGAEVPFLRPKDLAQDDTPDRPVYLHLINWLKEKENYRFDNLVILRPTTPFKTSEMIDKSIQMLNKNPHLTTIRTVTKAKGIFHPYWMYKAKNGLLKPFMEKIDTTQYHQRQLLPKCFRLNGVIDILRVDIILKNKNPYGDKIGFLEIDEYSSIDIDSRFDFELCEFLMNRKKRK